MEITFYKKISNILLDFIPLKDLLINKKFQRAYLKRLAKKDLNCAKITIKLITKS